MSHSRAVMLTLMISLQMMLCFTMKNFSVKHIVGLMRPTIEKLLQSLLYLTTVLRHLHLTDLLKMRSREIFLTKKDTEAILLS